MHARLRRRMIRRFRDTDSRGSYGILAPCLLGGMIFLAGSASISHASVRRSPEKETLRLSRTLRPISDETWREVAGDQITGHYEITRGDTLYDISKRLFGDPRYWPKIWAMNNDSILNPHLIHPGNRIAFMPGSVTSLPSVEVEADSSDITQTVSDVGQPMPDLPPRPHHSQEWRKLPPQPWEAAKIEAEEAALQDVKLMGSLRKIGSTQFTQDLPVFASSHLIEPVGVIVSSPQLNTYFRTGDQVVVHGGDDIQAGNTYTLIGDPDLLDHNEKHRQGWAYRNLGQVQIIRAQDEDWIAVITEVRGFVARGTPFIPLLSRISAMDPVPAPATLNGIFYLDRGYSSFITAQGGFGFVNLGSEDGLQPGMILESFHNSDQNTGQMLDEMDTFHFADLQVVQVSERYSTLQVIAGNSEISEGTPLRLLTDVSQFKKYGAVAPDDSLPPPASDSSSDGGDLPPAPPPAVPSDAAPPPPPPDQPPADDVPPPPQADDATPPAPPETPPSPQPSDLQDVPPPPADSSAPVDIPPPPPAENSPSADAPPPAPEKNELDALDKGDRPLQPNEKRELKQLEHYQAKLPEASPDAEASSVPAPPPAPVDVPPPPGSDEVPPPPAASDVPPPPATGDIPPPPATSDSPPPPATGDVPPPPVTSDTSSATGDVPPPPVTSDSNSSSVPPAPADLDAPPPTAPPPATAPDNPSSSGAASSNDPSDSDPSKLPPVVAPLVDPTPLPPASAGMNPADPTGSPLPPAEAKVPQ